MSKKSVARNRPWRQRNANRALSNPLLFESGNLGVIGGIKCLRGLSFLTCVVTYRELSVEVREEGGSAILHVSFSDSESVFDMAIGDG